MADETIQPATMPPAVTFVLTHRLPCAVLLVVMLMAALWLPLLAQNLPVLLVMLASIAGLGLHMLAPGLIALVAYGGGTVFAAQVAAIASLVVSALADFALLPGLVVLLVYGLLPSVAAAAEMKEDGARRSMQYLALGLGAATLGAMAGGAMTEGVSLRDFVSSMLAPMFETVQSQLPETEPQALQMLEQFPCKNTSFVGYRHYTRDLAGLERDS